MLQRSELYTGVKLSNGWSDLEIVTTSSVIVSGKSITTYLCILGSGDKSDPEDIDSYSLEELNADEYKLVKDVKELTVKEISEKLGYEVKVVEG